jgi:hypothetical protein
MCQGNGGSTETYTDIGGLEKQIEELVEAIVFLMEQADKFKTLGVKPLKGCLIYRPPGACAFIYMHTITYIFNRYRENSSCPCMCSANKDLLSQACWSFTCPDVHR